MASAVEVMARAEAVKVERVQRERDNGPYDWADGEALKEFITVMESVRFWSTKSWVSPGVNQVVATVADTEHGRMWVHVAAEMLDRAAADFDLPDDAEIEVLSPTQYALTWSSTVAARYTERMDKTARTLMARTSEADQEWGRVLLHVTPLVYRELSEGRGIGILSVMLNSVMDRVEKGQDHE